MIEPLIAALVTGLASVVFAVGAYVFKRRTGEQQDRLLSELDQLAKKRWEVGLSIGGVSLRRVVESGGEGGLAPSQELLKRIEEQVLARVAASSGLTKEDVQREVDGQLVELQDRLAKIEGRFPEEARLEKFASINDALLSERIDQLAKQVEALEKRVLSKWDVALTVSSIIAGIAFVVGIAYAVFKALGATTP